MSKPIIGHSDIANFLLDNEVNVNTRDSDKWSPLISAAKHGDADLVHNLLRAGALQNEDENEIVDMVLTNRWSYVEWPIQSGSYSIETIVLLIRFSV